MVPPATAAARPCRPRVRRGRTGAPRPPRQRIGAGDDDLQRAVRRGRQQRAPGVRADVVSGSSPLISVMPLSARPNAAIDTIRPWSATSSRDDVDGLVRTDRVDRRVHSLGCDRADPVGQPGSVGHRDRSVAPQQLVVGLAGGPDHPDPVLHGELDGDLADTARSAVHQQRLAGLRPSDLQCVGRCAAHEQDGSRDRPVERRRLRYNDVRRAATRLGVPTADGCATTSSPTAIGPPGRRRPDRRRSPPPRPRAPPATAGGPDPPPSPRTILWSTGLMPAALTAITTWPGPGCGTSTSTGDRTSGPPNAVATT